MHGHLVNLAGCVEEHRFSDGAAAMIAIVERDARNARHDVDELELEVGPPARPMAK
jgi:hypothetical protein